jgi:AcrR family transcriptional regulator
VARWEAGTPERLQRAALELFASQGFDQTTAADIAAAVGLTERTFFRHFSDKREVLFHGQADFERSFLEGIEAAPSDACALDVVASAVEAAAVRFGDERRPFSRMRQTVIDQNPALQERERHKLAVLAGSMAEALRARGVDELTARLAAESGATVFGLAFGQWIRDGEQRSFAQITAEVFDGLRGLAAGRAPAPVQA